MTWFVTVGVLTYHTRTEERQFGIGSRSIREQAVEFVGKAFAFLQEPQVPLYRADPTTYSAIHSTYICATYNHRANSWAGSCL
jgi:hypothetical protein